MTDKTVSSRPNVFVAPVFAAGGNTSVQSDATGTAYATFPSQSVKRLVIVNDTGTDLEFQQDGAGSAVTVASATVFEIYGISNASQIGVRRKDVSTTQVTVKARWED